MLRRMLRIGLAALVFVTSQAAAQDRQLTGTVTRAGTNTPIAEATVTVVGGSAVARTNAQGRFTLANAPAGQFRIAVRGIGYKRKEALVAAGATTVEVVLSEDVFKLDEVVTTGQATSIEKRNATTATVTVDAENLNRAPAQSLDQALQGKVLGATVSLNGGGPGGGGQVQIRGASSILGNSQPLFVVDGTIISNDAFSAGGNAIQRASGTGSTSVQDNLVNRLSDLNPNEIESIEVLKSAAATAIYGSRATNGVIVIRTKRGAAGATRVNITQRVGTQEPLRLIPLRTFSSVQEIVDIPYGNGGSRDSAGIRVQVPTNPATIYLNSAFPTGVIPASANRDFLKEFYDNRSPSYETAVSVTGGSETFQYFLSAGNRQETGLAPNTGAKLQTLRFNADQSWKKGLKLSVSANITRNNLDRGLAGNDNTCTSPVYCIPYTPGVINLDSLDANGNYIRNPFNNGGNRVSNWFETFEFLTYDQDIWRSTGSTTLSYAPVQTEKNTVSLAMTGGLDRYQQAAYISSPPFLQFEGGVDGLLGRVVQSSVDGFNYNAQLNGVWTTNAIKDISFTTSVGAAVERQQTNNYLARARGTLPGVETIGQGVLDATQDLVAFRDQALFANEQILALDSKLTLSGGVRADRSSANGDRSKFYLFPRASASYLFENPIKGVSSFKVRGGWGQTGNRPLYGDRDLVGSQTLIGGLQGVGVVGTVRNAQIKPETLTELELGVDATLVGDRVRFEGSVYRRNISDLLLRPAVAASTGFSAVTLNSGELTTRGIEAGVTVVPVNTADLQWTVQTTFQKFQQKVSNLPSFAPRFNPSIGLIRIANNQETTLAWGNIPYFTDAAGNPTVPTPIGWRNAFGTAGTTVRDTIFGNTNPDFQMFFNNSVSYKALTLGFSVDWRNGGLVQNFTQRLLDEGGTSADWGAPLTLANAPKGTTQEVINALPANTTLGRFRYIASGPANDLRIWTQDGSFVRVRDISLSYDLPKSLSSSIGSRAVRLSLQARNVFMWTKYTGFDPENNRAGSSNIRGSQDLAAFPGARQIFLSADVGF